MFNILRTPTILFTSDTHFDHSKIIAFTARPFANVEEMNETIIQRWNEVVRPTDEIWHLGDFAFNRHRAHFKRLNGQKKKLRGNHDKKPDEKLDWLVYEDRVELEIGGFFFVLDHYPIHSWNRKFHGSIHLHGHAHSSLAKTAYRRLDVGVDAHDFRPWTIDELLEELRRNGDLEDQPEHPLPSI